MNITALISYPLLISILIYDMMIAPQKNRVKIPKMNIRTSVNYLIVTGISVSILCILIAIAMRVFSVFTSFRNRAFEVFVLLTPSFSAAFTVLCLYLSNY
jgi:hypothetical protein